MKLLPKARPVQINKLKLQGTEINSIEELKKHFYVWEIIALGNKFIVWLDRHDETRVYSKGVIDIFKNNKNTSATALSLISIFFNRPTVSIATEIETFRKSGANDGVLASIFQCQDPDESTAISILSDHTYREAQWIKPWLLRCADIPDITPELQYLLADALKDYNYEVAKRLIESARVSGHKGQTIPNLEDKSITITISLNPIKLNKVSFYAGDFYITCNVLPSWLFKEFHLINYGASKSHTSEEFNQLLKILGDETGYKWDFPTIDEWTEAYNYKAFKISSKKEKEWCKSGKSGSHKMVIEDPYTYKGSRSAFEQYPMHAVIRISQNPKLQ